MTCTADLMDLRPVFFGHGSREVMSICCGVQTKKSQKLLNGLLRYLVQSWFLIGVP